MGWKISKPLGGKNSIVRRVYSKPGATILGTMTGQGLYGGSLGSAITDVKGNFESKYNDYQERMSSGQEASNSDLANLEQLARTEEEKRRVLGLRQRGQIEDFATGLEGRAKDYRNTLAQSLADTGESFFNRLNPQILEDLNSRGLFTSQTARDQEQSRALSDIARENESALSRFDTDIFNQLNDIRGTALSAELGGDQSALDSALALRKAAIQRRFDEADAQREQAFAEMLARRQSRDSLISSIIGLSGSLGSGFIGRG